MQLTTKTNPQCFTTYMAHCPQAMGLHALKWQGPRGNCRHCSFCYTQIRKDITSMNQKHKGIKGIPGEQEKGKEDGGEQINNKKISELFKVCHLDSKHSRDTQRRGYRGEEISKEIIQENFPESRDFGFFITWVH